MSRKQKRMGPVGCFGQIENIKRQSLNSKASKLEKSALDSFNTVEEAFSSLFMKKAKEGVPKTFSTIYEGF